MKNVKWQLIDWSDVFLRTYKDWNSTILSTLIWSHSFAQLPARSSSEKVHFCLSYVGTIIFELGINWLITKNSIFSGPKLYNFIHSNLKSLVRSVASSLLMWKSAFLSVFVSHAPLSESLTSKPVLACCCLPASLPASQSDNQPALPPAWPTCQTACQPASQPVCLPSCNDETMELGLEKYKVLFSEDKGSTSIQGISILVKIKSLYQRDHIFIF